MVNIETVQDEIRNGLKQIDDSFEIDSFNYEHDRETRQLTVAFAATNNKDQTIEIVQVWG